MSFYAAILETNIHLEVSNMQPFQATYCSKKVFEGITFLAQFGIRKSLSSFFAFFSSKVICHPFKHASFCNKGCLLNYFDTVITI